MCLLWHLRFHPMCRTHNAIMQKQTQCTSSVISTVKVKSCMGTLCETKASNVHVRLRYGIVIHHVYITVHSQYLPSPVGGKRGSIAPSSSWSATMAVRVSECEIVYFPNPGTLWCICIMYLKRPSSDVLIWTSLWLAWKMSRGKCKLNKDKHYKSRQSPMQFS